MPLMMRTTTGRAARTIATELSAEGFLAHATEHHSIPLVVVSCMANEYGQVAERIRRRDPGSVALTVTGRTPVTGVAHPVTAAPPAFPASA